MVLKDYKYIPDLWVNLFSITKSIQNGWNIGNEGLSLFLKKGKTQVTFDEVIHLQHGLLMGVTIVPQKLEVAVPAAILKQGNTVDITSMHNLFGHSWRRYPAQDRQVL